MKFFPISFDNFGELMERQLTGEHLYYFADKSLLVRDLLDCKDKVVLLTRPRRFGKTTNMSMLEHFFNVVNAERNRGLFTDLKIAAAKTKKSGSEEPCMNYQGRYPVIFMTFKSCVYNTFEENYARIKQLLRELYAKYDYLLGGDKLKPVEKAVFQKILEETATDAQYNIAIQSLCKYLQVHHGKKVIVLIDEYDTPFQVAFYRGYYDQLQPMMRTLVGEVLKNTDDFLEKAVLTGILRIAGAGMFSGANNVSVYTVLDERFSEYFGFTEEEVKSILADMEKEGIAGATQRFPEMSHWYNGYQFGRTIIYNPWSTMKCLSREFDFSAHWVSTGSDSLLRKSFMKLNSATQTEIVRITKRETVTIKIDKELRFDGDLDEETHFWTLLLSAGYLKSVDKKPIGDQVLCRVEIPNEEVSYVYLHLFEHWMHKLLSQGDDKILAEYLLTGETERFCVGLKRLLMECASVRDMRSNYIESFYKGFMIAIIGLSIGSHTQLESERESGLGYSDLMLMPRDLSDPRYQVGIVIELKRTENSEELKAKAAEGLGQIKNKHYETAFRAYGIDSIVIISLAFCGKELEYLHEKLVSAKQLTVTQLITRPGSDAPILADRKRPQPEGEQDLSGQPPEKSYKM